ncbi:hypothetical protein [Halobacillus andaensis]|uniref:hypothetical protein n=1 Tax=Halobacillus andaensis TaxID=1176239 RepID=UPI003D758AB7
MNKVLFFFSNLLVVLGVCTLFVTSILSKTIPLLGRTAYQAAAAGSYAQEDYIVNFTTINIIAFLLIAIGAVSSYLIYKQVLVETEV